MVERFCEQQQAVSAVLADDRKKWHLMPRDSDGSRMFTDALSGEKEATLSSVPPLIRKIRACLEDEEGDSPLTREMKHNSKQDFENRYDEYNLKMTLNIATFLDPRFKNMFVTMEEEVRGNFSYTLTQFIFLGSPARSNKKSQWMTLEQLHQRRGEVT